MALNRTTTTVTAALSIALYASAANAGGLERGGYNIDLLFEPSTYAAEAAATYVNPQRELDDVVDTDTTSFVPVPTGLGGGDLNGRPDSGIGETEDYWVPRIGVKAAIGDSVDCLADYSQPWGAHSKPGLNWAGANDNIETKIESDNYAATCSYKFDMGKGQFRLIGGAFYQEVGGFKERLVQDFSGLPVPFTGVGRLDLEDSGWGWRTGVAYEIPEYAFRTSLVYNSQVELDNLEGTLDLTNLPASPISPIFGVKSALTGSATMPESLELKFQSGIASDWLAFGSIKWTNWSILQTIPLFVGSVEATSLDLLYRDGWTVSGGVGHKFNDQWSGAVSLTWDRGTSTGLGSQTDAWTVGTGVSYAPTENVEFRLAGAVGILTSGESGTVTSEGETYGEHVSYSFGNDIVTAVSTQLKVKF